MPSPISRRPAGLLDLLLTQQQGKNPSELLDEVQPIVDMGPFYDSERLVVQREGVAAAATGPYLNDTIDVPNGEYWKVLGVSIDWTSNAANQSCTPSIWAYNLGANVVLLESSTKGGSTSNIQTWSQLFPQPIHFPSGTRFVFELGLRSLGGAANLLTSFSVMYVRMET